MTRIEGFQGASVPAPSAAELLSEIGQLIDCEVELVARGSATGPVYMIVPVDRKRLWSSFWQAVKVDPCGGVWKSPESAVVGFAYRCLMWLRVSRRRSPSAVEKFVQHELGQTRVAPAKQVITAAQSVGISAATLRRAATRLGVQAEGQHDGRLAVDAAG
jgi:hypothetical protein